MTKVNTGTDLVTPLSRHGKIDYIGDSYQYVWNYLRYHLELTVGILQDWCKASTPKLFLSER